MPSPMPLAAPVTKATFPSKSRMPIFPRCGSIRGRSSRESGLKELGSLGMDGARLRRVEETIAGDIAAHRYDGAALRVHRRGRLVLDIVQGYAHRGRGTPLSSDAVFVTFSSGKQITVVAVLQYVEKG